MSLLNIYKPCKRRFLLLSCIVLWLPCSSLGPQTIDVLEGVGPPLRMLSSAQFSPGLQEVCALVSTWTVSFLSSLVISCLCACTVVPEDGGLLRTFHQGCSQCGGPWLECMVPIEPQTSSLLITNCLSPAPQPQPFSRKSSVTQTHYSLLLLASLSFISPVVQLHFPQPVLTSFLICLLFLDGVSLSLHPIDVFVQVKDTRLFSYNFLLTTLPSFHITFENSIAILIS